MVDYRKEENNASARQNMSDIIDRQLVKIIIQIHFLKSFFFISNKIYKILTFIIVISFSYNNFLITLCIAKKGHILHNYRCLKRHLAVNSKTKIKLFVKQLKFQTENS